MTLRYEPSVKGQRFVESLQGFEERKERGALAALRRGLGRSPGTAPEMYPYIEPWTVGERPGWNEDVYYLVAALFAYHPGRWVVRDGPSDMGGSFAQLVRLPRVSTESVERRFTALLGSDREDLHQHLRHAVSLLKSGDVPVDWARLLDDLRWWEDDERRVQRRWARAFWGRMPAGGEDGND